ncbi:Pentatricopeptide repeat-containing protein [Artemisia annua]|uniref:Pentatricopeptide repeat-containing protein n=1 Tax=Artemisia annua TaxID=35608 RepID=A0A2U1L2L0_ARTAN|nr:Pentatricopeptide repeat-containing protein [Artemisia annua]
MEAGFLLGKKTSKGKGKADTVNNNIMPRPVVYVNIDDLNARMLRLKGIDAGLLEFYAKHGFVKDMQSLFHSMREKNSVTWNSMITCYSKIGDVKSAQLVFDHNPIKDVVSWNAMMHGYYKAGQLSVAETLFNRIGDMKNSNECRGSLPTDLMGLGMATWLSD